MPAFSALTLLYEFSHLPSDDSAIERAHGSALIGFDGKGMWWIDTIRVYGQQPGDPTRRLSRTDPDFDRVAMALDMSRCEEIEAAIVKKLRQGGGHMALFGEHMPNTVEGRRAPPYAHPNYGLRLAA